MCLDFRPGEYRGKCHTAPHTQVPCAFSGSHRSHGLEGSWAPESRLRRKSPDDPGSFLELGMTRTLFVPLLRVRLRQQPMSPPLTRYWSTNVCIYGRFTAIGRWACVFIDTSPRPGAAGRSARTCVRSRSLLAPVPLALGKSWVREWRALAAAAVLALSPGGVTLKLICTPVCSFVPSRY